MPAAVASSARAPRSATTSSATREHWHGSPTRRRRRPGRRVRLRAELLRAVGADPATTSRSRRWPDRRPTRCGSPTGGCCCASPPATSPTTSASTTSPRELADLAAATLEAALAVARAELGDRRRHLPARRDRHGQVRRPRAQLRQRRRRHLRRRAASTGADEARGAAQAATQLAVDADAGLLRPHRRGHDLAGRRGAAARGQGRPAGPHAGQPRRLLRALGQDLGVPGAAQGAAGRRRPRARPGVRRDDRAAGVAGGRARRTSSPTCRRCAAGSSSTSRAERGRPPAQARPRRAARRRVRGPAAAARARPQPTTALRSGTTLAALEALADGGYVGRDDGAALARRLPVPAHARAPAPAAPAAPHPRRCPRTRPALRRLGRVARATARTRSASSTAAWRRHAREVRRLHEKLFYRPLLAAVARLPGDEARLTPEAAQAAARGARLPRPRGRAAPPRGADRRVSAGAPRSSARCCR